MPRRLVRLLLSAVAVTPFSVAAITDSSQGFVGVIPLITQVLGIEGNMTNLMAFLATFAFMNLSVYMIFKILFRSASERSSYISDRDLFGGSDGRNLVAVLSVLFTIAGTFGAGSAGIVNGFQSLITLALGLGFVAAAAFVILGGGGAALGSIPFSGALGLRAGAKGVEEAGKQVGADQALSGAADRIGQAYESMRGGEKDAEEGNLQDAEKEFENTVKLMKAVAPDLGEDFEAMGDRLEEAHRDYANAVRDESDEEARLSDIGNRIKRVRLYLETAANGGSEVTTWIVDHPSRGEIINTGSGTYSKNQVKRFIEGSLDINDPNFEADIDEVDLPSEYGLGGIEEDIQKIQEDLRIAEKDYQDESGDLAEATKDFENVVEKAIRAQSLIRKMINILEELEEDSEKMEAIEEKGKLEKLHNASESMISEEKKVEDIISQLEDYESEIESKIESVLGTTSRFLEYDGKEIEQLKEELKWESGLEDTVIRFRDAFGNSQADTPPAIDNDILEDGAAIMSDIIDKISTLHDEMETMINQFEDEEREVYGRMESILGEAAENEGQNKIASEIGEDLRDWLGEGDTRYT